MADKAEALRELFVRMGNGESLRNIAKDMGLPESTLRGWALEDDESFAQYARAREAQAHALFEDIADLARSAVGLDKDLVQGYKLAIDAKKWQASKLLPREYGEKQQHEVSGKDGGALVLQVVYEDEGE
jgi:hypothetical protein